MKKLFLLWTGLCLTIPHAYSMNEAISEEEPQKEISPSDSNSEEEEGSSSSESAQMNEEMENRLKVLEMDNEFQEDFEKIQQAAHEYNRQSSREYINQLNEEEKGKLYNETVRKMRIEEWREKLREKNLEKKNIGEDN